MNYGTYILIMFIVWLLVTLYQENSEKIHYKIESLEYESKYQDLRDEYFDLIPYIDETNTIKLELVLKEKYDKGEN